jgi:hypothetical protein
MVVDDGMVLRLASREGDRRETAEVRLIFEGGRAAAIEGEEPRETSFHFLRGSDGEKWQRGVRGYGRIIWRELAPCIDLVLREGEGGFEYDLLLGPDADLEALAIRAEGAVDLRI